MDSRIRVPLHPNEKMICFNCKGKFPEKEMVFGKRAVFSTDEWYCKRCFGGFEGASKNQPYPPPRR